ncbi:MAG: signal peptidase II [Candidatus Marsarchaeota archaeon]|nr:signal peptidase II [Candidatus Marsarchaeota archaeon]
MTGAALFALDQATKYLVLSKIPIGTDTDVIPHFFRIVSVRNTGIVFGLFSQSQNESHQGGFILFTALALFAILYYSHKKKVTESREFYPLALILGGATGNLLDRILHGRVIDFLDFYVGDYHWPAFNIADSGIVIGVGLLLFLQWGEERKQKRAPVEH